MRYGRKKTCVNEDKDVSVRECGNWRASRVSLDQSERDQ
jgi:hypothetical protein